MSANMHRNKRTSTSRALADIDEQCIEPSPKRIRNILTLDERVSAILAYDCCSMYTRVAKMFNCSWEQIKNIIQNREAILELYESTKQSEKSSDPNKEEMRELKIGFLGECMYEYIQRFQFHTKKDITEDIIRTKANEFREIIQIPQFTANKGWINHFKATYNFSLSNRQITLTRTPPASLDPKDIMTYCTKHKPTVELNFTPQAPPPTSLHRWRTEVSVLTMHNAALKEFQERRQRKINFLERALHEYVQRAKFHQKMQLTDELLLNTALELRDLLKIENFERDEVWLAEWKARFKLLGEEGTPNSSTPPLSLDLRDILSYCSRHVEKSAKVTSIKLAPKESDDVVPAFKKIKLVSPQPQPVQLIPAPTQAAKAEIVILDDDTEEDVKPDFTTLRKSESKSPSPSTSKLDDIKTEPCTNNSNQTDAVDWPQQVRSYADALKLLKPLEEFALLEENYRAIGLLTQLENIFKNPERKTD